MGLIDKLRYIQLLFCNNNNNNNYSNNDNNNNNNININCYYYYYYYCYYYYVKNSFKKINSVFEVATKGQPILNDLGNASSNCHSFHCHFPRMGPCEA